MMSLEDILAIVYGSALLMCQLANLDDVPRKLECDRFRRLEDTEGMNNNRRFVGEERVRCLVAYLAGKCEQG